MPYTLKTNQISVKDPETGEYSGVDILAEQTEQGLIAELQAEGTTQVNRINQAAVDVQAAVDQAESDAAGIISDTQAAVNRLEIEKNTIAESVASMAELGTDTTLSTPGMAADAGAVGDLSRQLSDLAQGNKKQAIDFEWEIGDINMSGEIVPSSTSYSHSRLLSATEFYSMKITTDHTLDVYAYKADGTFFGRRSGISSGTDITPSAGSLSSATQCRLVCQTAKKDNISAYIIAKVLATNDEVKPLELATDNLPPLVYSLSSEHDYINFDGKISTGNISGAGVVEANNGRLITAELIELKGNVLEFEFLSHDFKVECHLSRPDGSNYALYPGEQITDNLTFTIPNYLLYAKYVRFVFTPITPTDFTASGIPAFLGVMVKNYPQENKQLKINVLSYNLRCLRGFSNATPDYAPLTDAEIKTCIETMSNYIGSFDPDLFIACEDRPWFDAQAASDISGGTKSVYEMLWKHWFPYKFDIEYGITVPRLYSKYPILYGRRLDVTYPTTPQSNRPISTVLISINEVPIWVIPVHATADPTAYDTDRVPYFQTIVDFCSDKEHVILAGDFNTDTEYPAEELEVFTEAGFTLGNHGIFGDKKTYVSGSGYTTNRLDNIVVKGFTLNNFIVGTEEYSDHYPVFSNINLR